jgi:hypothetical protein
MANLPLKIRRGVTFRALITISGAGVPSVLTGKAIVFHVVRKSVGKDLFTFTVDTAEGTNDSRFYYTNAAAGECRIKIADEDTLLFKTGGETYTWWIGILEADDVDEIAAGTFNVTNP